jgi:hypothetical protein
MKNNYLEIEEDLQSKFNFYKNQTFTKNISDMIIKDLLYFEYGNDSSINEYYNDEEVDDVVNSYNNDTEKEKHTSEIKYVREIEDKYLVVEIDVEFDIITSVRGWVRDWI